MSNANHTWEVALLTPLHIGDGIRLRINLDYFRASSDAVQVVDMDELLEQLEDRPGTLGETGHHGFALDRFLEDYGLRPGGYRLPVSGGDPREILSFVKNAWRRPYLPGSSLKGAIRTALLAPLLQARHGPNAASARDFRDWSRDAGKIAGRDPHHDFLRMLRISDSPAKSPGILKAEEVKFLNLVSENRAGWKSFGGNKKTVEDHKKAQGVHVETVKAGSSFLVQASLDGFFTGDVVRGSLGLPEIEALGNAEALARAVNRHTLERVRAERDFFARYGSAGKFAAKACEQLEKVGASCREGEFVLRLAWGSGWKGMTGDWMSDDSLEKVRRREKLGKLFCPRCGAPNPKFFGRRGMYSCRSCGEFPPEALSLFPVFPKTRRLALQNGIPCLPMGWVKATPASRERFERKSLNEEG